MRTHTSSFKNAITKFGRQIKGKIYYYNSYSFSTEDNNLLITEDNLQLITEQFNPLDKSEISAEDIFQMQIIKNGNLFQSLMKQFNFETTQELNIGSVVNPHFGVMIDAQNDEYEFLDYGNFIIKEKEYNLDKKTWSYVSYDKMLYSMILYKPPQVTFPITIENYLIAIAEKIGISFQEKLIPIQGGGYIAIAVANKNELVYEELFDNQSLSYRDVFDKFAEIFGGNLIIDDNDNMICDYLEPIDDTKETDWIFTEQIKDLNTTFSKKVKPFNKIAIKDTESNIEIVAENSQMIDLNDVSQITITDNPLAFNNNTQNIAQNILNKWSLVTNEFYYYDFTTTGLCYYDFLDRVVVNVGGNEFYPCLVLNNEITITQGIEEHISMEEIEQTKNQSENEYITPIINSKDATLTINKQKAEIESKVSKDGIISSINQTPEEIKISASKIKLEGYTTINDGFSIDEQGNMTANNGVFNGLITAGKIEVSGYTEDNPYISVGENFEDPTQPYGVYIWDTGISATDYRFDHEPLIRTEGPSGGYAQLKGINIECIGTVTSVRGVCQGSREELKKNIKKLTNAKKILNSTDIYKYNLKTEKDDEKKHIGFVIGKKYNYSKEITSKENDNVDLYSMVSVLWQVVKEQQEEINELKEVIKNGKH